MNGKDKMVVRSRLMKYIWGEIDKHNCCVCRIDSPTHLVAEAGPFNVVLNGPMAVVTPR